MKKIFPIILFLLYINSGFANKKLLSKQEIENIVKKGSKYFKEADFVNSLKTCKIALIEAENAKEYELASKAANRIARNFEEILDDKNALFFYYKALSYAEKANSDSMKTTVYINLGNIYTTAEKKDFKKGIAFMKKALVLSKNMADFETIVTVNMNLAWMNFDQKEFKTGYPYLEYVNNNYKKWGDKDFYISVKMLNGQYLSYLNQDQKANATFLEGINHNQDQDAVLREEKQLLYLRYSEFLNKINDHKNAYVNLVKYNELNQKLFNEKKIVAASLSGLNVLVENYKNELTQSDIIEKSQAEKLSLSHNLMFVLAALIILLLSSVFVIYKSYRKNIKTNSDLVENNKKLLMAIEKADEANKIKTQFVSTISHELRTPLYGVVGITDLIFDEYKNIVDRKHLNALKFSARYLLTLINDVLQISKMDAVEMRLDNKPFNLRQEVSALKNALEIIVPSNMVSLEITINENVPEWILGDQTRLSQVLMNLVSNGLKFTKVGKVSLSLELEKIVDHKSFIKFVVQDTGMGISAENQERIFEKFVQLNQDEGNYQGTGLGLSIVKKIIDLFETKIDLESKVNVGSKFSFTVGFNNDFQIPSKEKVLKYNILENIKVLVVEDNTINQLVSKKIIEQKKMICTVVSSGQEAIDLLKSESFDIILMDINMPNMNGFEATKNIQSIGIQTPIIALTAYSNNEVKSKALFAGIADLIEKPFEPQHLFEVIANLVVKRKS